MQQGLISVFDTGVGMHNDCRNIPHQRINSLTRLVVSYPHKEGEVPPTT